MKDIYTTDINTKEIDKLFFNLIKQRSINAYRSAHTHSVTAPTKHQGATLPC